MTSVHEKSLNSNTPSKEEFRKSTRKLAFQPRGGRGGRGERGRGPEKGKRAKSKTPKKSSNLGEKKTGIETAVPLTPEVTPMKSNSISTGNPPEPSFQPKGTSESSNSITGKSFVENSFISRNSGKQSMKLEMMIPAPPGDTMRNFIQFLNRYFGEVFKNPNTPTGLSLTSLSARIFSPYFIP